MKAVGYKDEKRPGGYAKWAKTLKVGDFVAIYDPASTKPLPVFALWEVTRKAVSYGPKPYGCRAWRKDNGHTANGYDSGRSVMVPAQYPVLPE